MNSIQPIQACRFGISGDASRRYVPMALVLAYFSLLGVVCCGQSQDIRRLAEEKFGKDSRIWFSEPGDKSLDKWESAELVEETGILLEWNADEVVLLRPDAKNESRIAGDLVVRIEPNWTDPVGEKIHSLFGARQFQTVLAQGADAIKSKTMPKLPWQQRLILAEMIESRSALGNPDLAGRLFAALAKTKPPQLLLATIPLPWGQERMDIDLPKMQSLAEEWILDETEALRLLGAAWLLSGKKRSAAIEALEGVSKNSKSPVLASYAKAQLWRTVPPAELLSDRYPKWIAERDRMLLPIQAGPTLLLAQRLSQAGQNELAIQEWLRIATLHAERYHLAIAAITNASQALRSLGRKQEADQVEQLLKRYESMKPNG
jgi:hypothetical protein